MYKHIINQPELGLWFYEKFIIGKNLSSYKLSILTGLTNNRISLLIHGRGRFTPKIDALFCKFFSLEEGFFLKKQMDFDINNAKKIYKDEVSRVRELSSLKI